MTEYRHCALNMIARHARERLVNSLPHPGLARNRRRGRHDRIMMNCSGSGERHPLTIGLISEPAADVAGGVDVDALGGGGLLRFDFDRIAVARQTSQEVSKAMNDTALDGRQHLMERIYAYGKRFGSNPTTIVRPSIFRLLLEPVFARVPQK